MELLNKVKPIIEKINKLHPDDPRIGQYWGELAEIFVEDERETISFLNQLTDKDLIKDISSVFEEISAALQSANFIACIKGLREKNPELNLDSMVRAADNAFFED